MKETETAFETPCVSAVRLYRELSGGPRVEYVTSKGKEYIIFDVFLICDNDAVSNRFD